MKKICYLLFLLVSANAFAQIESVEPNEPIIIGDPPRERMSTLVNGWGSHGVYLGFTTGYSQVNEKDILSLGLKFAYVADHKFEIGFAFEGLQSERGIVIEDNEPLYLTAGMGGIHLEPILFGRKSVHLSFPIFLGGGVAYLFEEQDIYFNEPPLDPVFPERYQEWEALLMAQPGVNVVFNISRFLQLEAGAKYRFTNDLNLYNNTIPDLNAFVGSVGLKVGFFDFGR